MPRHSDALPGFSALDRRLVPERFVDAPRAPRRSPAPVIGSGGGAISAVRLAQAGVRATVLERGFCWPHDPHREIFCDDRSADGRGFRFRTTAPSRVGLPSRVVEKSPAVARAHIGRAHDAPEGEFEGGHRMPFPAAAIGS